MSILIVEDDDGVQQALANVLREEGYEVEVVSDGSAALRRLTEGPAPSLILLNLMMPQIGTRSGAPARGQPRCRRSVIVVSARPDGPSTARQIGAVDFLPKPMSFEALLIAVQNTAITVVTTTGLPGKPKSLREAWRVLHQKS